MDEQVLTVYLRRHCHLCERMLRALEPWREAHELALDLVDVDEDPVLAARFGDRVPVLAAGEQVLAEFFLDEAVLARHLGTGEAGGGLRDAGRYERIHAIVRQIPAGRVASYGQVAAMEGHCTARMVGYAMAALPEGSNVPWQRVINARGQVSERAGGGGTSPQRRRLEAEGVFFDSRGRVDFARAGWDGPDPRWLAHHGFRCAPRPRGETPRRAGAAASGCADGATPGPADGATPRPAGTRRVP